jgi:cation diffusion facilitator CzcD-associated flavoprotein CzcO
MQTEATSKPARNTHHKVAIIGSGFGGLGTAIQLKKQGINDFVVLERAADVGGVWRDNGYPGAACDVQSRLYSFSFAPSQHWGNVFGRQPEIYSYLRSLVQRFDLADRLYLNQSVTRLDWQSNAQRWEVETEHGVLTADHVVLATGALADATIPQLPGIASFQGEAFHSSRWPQSLDLRGKRVAVIGTGASAIQFVPEIAPEVAELTVFQRTAPWVGPRRDREYSDNERRRMIWMPLLQRLSRWRIYLQREGTITAFRSRRINSVVQHHVLGHLRKQIADADLRRKLTPSYRLGCKRVLISNDYYPALVRPNVSVITEGVDSITPSGLIDAAGQTHPADVIIFGTGFVTSHLPLTDRTYGRDMAHSMVEHWGPSPRAYLGTSVNGFPNLYLLHGPNIGLAHTSVVHMLESQIAYVTKAIRYSMDHDLGELEPTQLAQRRFSDVVDRLTAGSVWTTGGCKSWYLDSTGRNSNLWPGSTINYRMRSRRFRPSDHTVQARRVRIAAEKTSVDW